MQSAANTSATFDYLDDFPVIASDEPWDDTSDRSFTDDKVYVVQTSTKVIERCLLMTTDPGDLVLDPTCGSGTTAYVAEQWGRRWITIDTSRVAVALARQRLLTAKYDYYEIKDHEAGDESQSPRAGFVYKTVPHITLKSIAQNQALDPIFARWEPVLAEKLAALNAALAAVTPAAPREARRPSWPTRSGREGKSAITDADRRRWLLPKERWQEWEVPFDTDPDWPEALQAALTDYRAAWRGKMDEVNATIAASAAQEELVDQPKVAPGVLRVSGPFTVEGVQPAEESLDVESPIGGEPEELETFPATGRRRRAGQRRGVPGQDDPAAAGRTVCASRTTRCSSSPGWSRWRTACSTPRANGATTAGAWRSPSARSTVPSPPSRWRSACARRTAAATTTWSSPASPSTARRRRSSRTTPTRACAATWPTSART